MKRIQSALWAILVAVSLVACGSAGPTRAPEGTTPSATAVASSPPDTTPTPSGFTITEAIAQRDGGTLGSDPITLEGYWTSRIIGHSCATPPQPQGEIDVWCHDGEYGMTERNEAIVQYTNDYRMITTKGAHFTPFMPDDITQVLLGGLMQLEIPPVPIVVKGHFDDARAVDCHPTRRQSCRERFVFDEILAFDPLSVPPATPAPPPTPFPSPAPAALFGPDQCAGDVPYAFVGWTTTGDLNIAASTRGHVFAMVTRDVVLRSDWIDDPAGSGKKFRSWGQLVCYSEDAYIGQAFNNVPIVFDSMNGTGFREWDDGRRERLPTGP